MNKTDNSTERILAAAIKLFAQKGYEGTSIREICKVAQANICMISYYWGGKQELYNGIIEDLIERQCQYAKTFINFDSDPKNLNKQEQIALLMTILDKFIAFFYSPNISKDLILFLLKEQQNSSFVGKSPAFNYLKKVVASIFDKNEDGKWNFDEFIDKNEDDKEIIFRTLFIISQLNSPRILPAFSLRLLGQDDFIEEDIKIIKENVKLYINALLKEANIV